jgi:hypothetical protein
MHEEANGPSGAGYARLRPWLSLLPRRHSAPWQTRHVLEVPAEIDGARVLQVADLSHTTPTGRTRHYREDELQTGFAALALAQYDADSGIYLLYCDENWTCLNDTHHDDLAEAKAQAEFEFDGVTFRDP